MIKLLIGTSIAALSICAMAQAQPIKPFTAQYNLLNNKQQVIGSITRKLHYPTPKQFDFQTTSKIHLLWTNDQITLDIHGHYTPTTLIPTTLNMSEVAHKATQKLALPKNSYDNASYILQMQSDLAHHKKNLNYHIYLGKKSYDYQFKQIGTQSLHTSLGTIKTVIVQSKPVKSIMTQFYFAPKYDYMLVKTEQYKKQKMILSSIMTQYHFNKSDKKHAA